MSKNVLVTCKADGSFNFTESWEAFSDNIKDASRLLNNGEGHVGNFAFVYPSGEFPRWVDERKFFLRLIEHCNTFPHVVEEGVPVLVIGAMLGQCIHANEYAPITISKKMAQTISRIANVFISQIVGTVHMGQLMMGETDGVGIEVMEGYVLLQEVYG